MGQKTFFKRFAIFLLIIIGIWIPLHWMLGPVDDAYITCRYAENLADGNGIQFNPGERVEGCTAFGMMVVLAAAGKIGIPNLVRVAQALGVLAWALTVTMAFGLIRKNRSGPISIADAVGTSFLIGGFVPLVWAFSGMETPIVAALWLGAVISHLKEEESQKLPVLSALLTVIAGLMRPDGILIAVPVALSMLMPPDSKRFFRTVIFSVIVIALFGGYWLWRWHYFGYLLPNTFYAKVGQGSFKLFTFGLFYVGKGMLALGLPLLTVLMLPKLGTHRKNVSRRTWIFFGIVCINTAYLTYVGGDFFPMQRFFVPMLAFWSLLFVDIARLKKEKKPVPPLKPYSSSKTAQAWIIAILVVIVANIVCSMVQKQLFRHIYLVGITEEWSQLGRRFENTLPEKSTIAAIPIGALGYWSDRYILDMLGLIDLHIAHLDTVKTGHAVIGHEKFDTRYVLQRRPDIILTWPILLRPIVRDLLDWNQNHLLSKGQHTMLFALKDNPMYTTLAVPIREDRYVITSVRSDLVDKAPYNAWIRVPPKANKILFADVQEVRKLGHIVGKKIFKGELQRAADRFNTRPTREQKLF